MVSFIGNALRAGLFAALAVASAAPVHAGSAWEEIKGSIYGDKNIEDGHGIVTLTAPNRPEDMRTVPIGTDVVLKDGRTIKSVSVIIDENPTPVVAVFNLTEARGSIALKSNFRVDRQSDVRAVVEASDGKLYMVSQLVKFAGGQASCSAPPQGDPAEIAANMGKMKMAALKVSDGPVSSAFGRAQIDMSHPNHTGMVMDQITLLYVPMNMVSEITVRQGGNEIMQVEGSIALSQNPMIAFDYRKTGSPDFEVTMKDTDGGSWTHDFHLGPES